MRLLATELYRVDLKSRMTVKYGIATMTSLPHVFLRVTGEFDGVIQTGVAADNLSPKWYTKDPLRDTRLEIDDMLDAIRQARRHALGLDPAANPFAFWRGLWDRQDAWAKTNRIAPLLAHLGTSLVERAIIDAFCRARKLTFGTALRQNEFGIQLGSLHAGLAGTAPSDWLPAAPPPWLPARHTVGMTDPLTDQDISPSERIDDGLPHSLEACIATYGVRYFKVKVGGPKDLPRLRAVAGLLARAAPADYACSMDGNETFRDIASFQEFWREICGDPALADFRQRVLFVEQPFHREIALSEAMHALKDEGTALPPIAIDESDAELTSAARALALGYAGTTHKNCRGIFKGVANACLMAERRRQDPGGRWSFTGEDMGNVGPVAMPQDLAVQAAIGVSNVERNGHHYFAGLSFWPPALQQQMRDHHPDLYRDSRDGWPTVRIENGRISTVSVSAAPFGVGFEFHPEDVAAKVD